MNAGKFTLYTKAYDGGPFNCRAAMSFVMEDKDIYTNEEPVLPGDKHPYNMRLWIITHEHGAICAVWSTCEQDALDSAVDLNALDCLMAEGQDHDDESLTALGNASELFDLTYAWCYEVVFDITRDWELLKALARAGAACQDTLEK
jgi:hypothetical protein